MAQANMSIIQELFRSHQTKGMRVRHFVEVIQTVLGLSQKLGISFEKIAQIVDAYSQRLSLLKSTKVEEDMVWITPFDSSFANEMAHLAQELEESSRSKHGAITAFGDSLAIHLPDGTYYLLSVRRLTRSSPKR